MPDDEEQLAASALADLLTSAMMRAHDFDKRTSLYGWELRGYQWLIRFQDRRPDGIMCAWSSAFIDLNRDAILAGDHKMDFNLRAARLAKEAQQT